jgi:hypothetical protein
MILADVAPSLAKVAWPSSTSVQFVAGAGRMLLLLPSASNQGMLLSVCGCTVCVLADVCCAL